MQTIHLNGEEQQIQKDTCLNTLIEQHCDATRRYAVAVNGDFIPRSAYADTLVNHGDTIDIVSPVGGG